MYNVEYGRIGDSSTNLYRILVDRLWPRGIAKQNAPWDEWNKDVAPSTPLRRWYGHNPARYESFCQQYHDELLALRSTLAIRSLITLAQDRPLILLTATRDPSTSHVPTLRQFLLDGI